MNDENPTPTPLETAYATQLKALEQVMNELAAKGGVGADPGWLADYAGRLHEIAARLEDLSGVGAPGLLPQHGDA